MEQSKKREHIFTRRDLVSGGIIGALVLGGGAAIKLLSGPRYRLKGEDFPGSGIKLYYLPDVHDKEFRGPIQRVAEDVISSHCVPLVGLEGLHGRLDDKRIDDYLDKKKRAGEIAAKYVRDFVKAHGGEGAASSLPDFDKSTEANTLIFLSTANLDPELQVAGVAPGLPYADRLRGKAELFGVEDPELYKQSAIETVTNILSGFHTMIKHDLSEQDLPAARKARYGHYISEFGRLNIPVERSFEEAQKAEKDLDKKRVDRRSEVAVGNLAAYATSKSHESGLLIYGLGHEDSVIDTCKKERISYAAIDL